MDNHSGTLTVDLLNYIVIMVELSLLYQETSSALYIYL